MKACSRKILDLFYNAKHSGRIIKPDAIGRVGNDNDGLVIELSWRVINGIITDAKFRAFGNPNAIAITSLITDNIINMSVENAMQIDESVIKENLDELLPEYLEVFEMVKMAMTEAYNNYLKRQTKQQNTPIDYKPANQDEKDDEENDLNAEIEKEIYSNISPVKIERRGRPRKYPKNEEENLTREKRGRGRPRKEVSPEDMLQSTEKRGRGRPRKIVDENSIVQVGEKRGRGRPRKIIDENEIVELKEKRGRGRPRKIVDESEIVVKEKRGRGRPRKEVSPEDMLQPTEKRGRGRPRKIIDENSMVQVGEKRGRGRPRKEEVAINNQVNSLSTNESQPFKANATNFVNEMMSSSSYSDYGDNYDVFKSNIRNILSGKDVHQTSNEYKVNNLDNEVNVDSQELDINEEKRGRGRPKKVVEEIASPQLNKLEPMPTVSSLKRSLTANDSVSMLNNTQDIVFASKNVTTTNININMTKTINNEQTEHEVNINKVEENTTLSTPSKIDEDNQEIEVDSEEDKDYDDINIKDEAPKGGIEYLLKALLDD